jgi:hypothetical protein
MAAIALLLLPSLAQAQENDGTNGASPPTRPVVLANRWEGDWSVLADPCVPREPFDSLKYIPLSPYNPKTYPSLAPTSESASRAMTGKALGSVPRAITII